MVGGGGRARCSEHRCCENWRLEGGRQGRHPETDPVGSQGSEDPIKAAEGDVNHPGAIIICSFIVETYVLYYSLSRTQACIWV